MRAGEYPNGARVLRARASTWAPATSTCATPCSSCTPPTRAREILEDLSELRLRARPVGRHRAHHAFHLHAGVQGPPSALRLVPGRSSGAVAPAPVRVRAAEHHLHRALQARADRAGARRPRVGLGRPQDADTRRHRGVPPAALRDFVKRVGVAKAAVDMGLFRVLGARGLNKAALGAWRCSAAAQGGDRELAGGQDRGVGRRQPPRRPRSGHAQGTLAARSPHRPGTT